MRLKLEEFTAYSKALEFSRSVSALLDAGRFGKDCDLRRQILRACDSVVANFAEGYEQPTDRAFANYLYHSKGSSAEIGQLLQVAARRRCISQEQCDRHITMAKGVCRLLAGLARYLYASDFKDRGHFKGSRNDQLGD